MGKANPGYGIMTTAFGIRRPIIAFAAALSTTTCWLVTMVVMAVACIAMLPAGLSSPWVAAFTLVLSIYSIVQTSSILVAQRASEMEARHRDEAMHAKLNELIRVEAKADNRFIGIEDEISEVDAI